MKREDVGFMVIMGGIIFLLVLPMTSQAFFSWSEQYQIIGGFLKFFVLASLGDLLSCRLKAGHYRVKGLLFKAIVWGFIGVVIVFVFPIFSQGVAFLQRDGLLPFEASVFFQAFFTSLFMNLIFAPTMMLFHRVSDHYIEQKIADRHHQLKTTLAAIDFRGFVSFVLFKTIPLFWIPAHTITFILPTTYRVFFAAVLGIALGLLLGIGTRKKRSDA